MKINRSSVRKKLFNIDKSISSLSVEDIIDKVCSIVESKYVLKSKEEVELVTENELKDLVNKTKNKFAVYHKPTKLWVYFREKRDKFGLLEETTICLCNKSDATISTSEEQLKNFLIKGTFNSCLKYGETNFLEFTIKTW